MKRPFRGLRHRGPRPRYDAVVVGGGVGGLVCAILLARERLSVLLVEQHYMLGGYCSTFRRAGFEFDAATHFYPLLGNRETLTGRLMVELGIGTRWVKMDPVDVFHLPDGSSFTVPADFGRYLERLKQRFPEEATPLDRFFAEVREAYLLGLLAYFRGQESPRLAALRDLTLRQALDRQLHDPRLKLILTADGPHWGSPPCRTSFVFDSMLRLSYFLGNYYPEGGSQAFADELGRRFEELGGDILMSTRAERLRVTDGRIAGLSLATARGELRGEHEVATQVVVSNADLLSTVDELLPAGSVDPAYQDEVHRLRPTFPCFLSHIGIAGLPARRLAEAQGYYWRTWDADAMGRDALIGKIFAPTLFEPRLAPPGGQIVILQKVLDMSYEGTRDWAAHKREVEEALFAHLCRVLPEAAGRVVVRTSATAQTAWRFTRNYRGAMLGWEMSPEQLGAGRPAVAGPVPGLWLVGHWTRPGGGITPVIVSAQHAAQAILTGRRRSGPPPDLAGDRGIE